MTSKLRRILTALSLPIRVLARWLRVHPAAVAAMLSLLTVVALLAVVVGTGSTGAAAAAQRPVAQGKEKDYTYSDLRSAIAARKVKTATLYPARAKVQVVLADGEKHTLGYSPPIRRSPTACPRRAPRSTSTPAAASRSARCWGC